MLAGALTERGGPAVAPHHLDLAAVPDHLRVTYRAVDDAGRPLAWSKDLAGAPSPAGRAGAGGAGRRLAGRRGARRDGHGCSARSRRRSTVTHAGHAVTGFPALVDEGDAVGLRVLPTEPEARAAMWGGTRRLLLLQLGSPLRTLDRALPNAVKLALSASDRLSAADAYRDSAAAAVDQLLVEHGGPVRDAGRVRGAGRRGACRRSPAPRSGLVELVAEALGHAAAIDDDAGRRCSPPPTTRRCSTSAAHLDRLLRRGWIADAGFDQLPDVVRYLRALEHRVQKARTEPDRDRRHIAGIQRLEREYRRVAARDATGEVRTMLEELRVSTFAQSVGRQGRRQRAEGPRAPSPR